MFPFVFLCSFVQDPSEQTAIDNFMVQTLDGTTNEWGWCKQKVQEHFHNYGFGFDFDFFIITRTY